MKTSPSLLVVQGSDNRGINIVDLMMWLVVAALLIATAIQSIGYYQKATNIHLMKDETNGVVGMVHASAAIEGETITEGIIHAVVEQHNAAHSTDDIVISYGSMLASTSEASGHKSGFELASVSTASSPSQVLYVKATSVSVEDRYVVYFFNDTRNFPQGISAVPKNSFDNGAVIEEATPGETVPPSTPATEEPTTEPTVPAPVETTPAPVETTPAPVFNPSIPNRFDVVAYDSSGELWNFGPVASDLSSRTSIGSVGGTIPDDFYVTDWNNDGVQDLVVQTPSGDLKLRTGLAAGGFDADLRIGTGWKDWEITVGKWKKTDTYPSVVAKHKPSGDLYYYPNEFGTVLDSLTRTKIATGWSTNLSQLNLADWDKDGNIDLIARTTVVNNDLMLYRTDGNGSFISTTGSIIGNGWSFASINMVSDRAGAGTAGFMARTTTGDLYYYPMRTASWGPRVLVSGGWSTYRMAGN